MTKAMTSAVTAVLLLAVGAGCADAPARGESEPVAGAALLMEVAAAYQEAPALADDMTVTVRSARGSRSRGAAVDVGPVTSTLFATHTAGCDR